MKTVIEHIKIDDDVIDGGDTYIITNPVWWSATIYEGEQKYIERLAPFSKEQRLLYAVRWYLSEVNNGGHDQFYFNSTGIIWKDALAGCRRRGIE